MKNTVSSIFSCELEIYLVCLFSMIHSSKIANSGDVNFTAKYLCKQMK